jgi:hypothetical protein
VFSLLHQFLRVCSRELKEAKSRRRVLLEVGQVRSWFFAEATGSTKPGNVSEALEVQRKTCQRGTEVQRRRVSEEPKFNEDVDAKSEGVSRRSTEVRRSDVDTGSEGCRTKYRSTTNGVSVVLPVVSRTQLADATATSADRSHTGRREHKQKKENAATWQFSYHVVPK